MDAALDDASILASPNDQHHTPTIRQHFDHLNLSPSCCYQEATRFILTKSVTFSDLRTPTSTRALTTWTRGKIREEA